LSVLSLREIVVLPTWSMTISSTLKANSRPDAASGRRSLAVPPELRGPGLVVPDNAVFRLKAGDRFIALKSCGEHEYLYCEVLEKTESRGARCSVINGGWTIRFSRKGRAPYRAGQHATIRMLLPRCLRGVRSMANYERVLEVAEKQLRRLEKASQQLPTQKRPTPLT
jgi:hypothetical protein